MTSSEVSEKRSDIFLTNSSARPLTESLNEAPSAFHAFSGLRSSEGTPGQVLGTERLKTSYVSYST